MNEQVNTLPIILEKFPRANLIQVPAIIHKLTRLSSNLGQKFYVLREDLTGFALGGNKSRKVDYLFGDALTRKATTAVTLKATSFSRNAAAAADAEIESGNVTEARRLCHRAANSLSAFAEIQAHLDPLRIGRI